MGKNGGGKPTTILTLEEALIRFKREREAGAEARVETASDSGVHQDDLSGTVEHADEGNPSGELQSADEGASVSAQRDASTAAIPAGEDIVAVIDGIPRTFEQLERIAAADKAYAEDFPEFAPDIAEFEDDDEASEVDVAMLAANRGTLIRDYAFTAMGTALMVLVAVLMTRVPIVNNQNRPTLMAQSVATPALKASSPMSADDLITTLVVLPDSDAQLASAEPRLASGSLEARIKDTLKLRAFTDIGVSVSKKGDAYLAGEVYSMNEARKIAQIVHSVNGVNRVHFMHPNVLPADAPAYFGATTAFAPDVWGAKVRAVFIGSPADKAGLQPGDVISEFDGKTIPDAKTFNDLIAQYAPGQRVQFRVWHDGQPKYLVARIGELTTVARS